MRSCEAQVTLSDTSSRLVLKFAGLKLDLDDRSTDNLPSAHVRRQTVASNPVACARAFHEMVEYFGEEVLAADRSGKRIGILGQTKTWLGTVEQQGRGSLHLHLLVWTHGQPTPAEMLAMLTDPAAEAFHARLIAKMDTFVKQDIDGVYDIAEGARLEARGGGGLSVDHTHASILARPDTTGTPEEWNELNEQQRVLLAKSLQLHQCTKTCYKSGNGVDCRFGYPHQLEYNTFVNVKTGKIILRRRHPSINGHNPDIITLFGSNSDIKFLYTGDSVLTRLHYMTKYMTKSEAVADRLVALALQQREMDARYANAPGDSKVLEARRFIVTIANRLGADQEISGVAAAFYILFNKDHFSPDTFVPLRLGMMMGRVNGMEAGLAAQAGADEAMEDFNLAEGEEGEMIEHNQADDYVHRDERLRNLSLYQLTARYRIINLPKTKPLPVAPSTRQSLSRYPFAPSHPRHGRQLLGMRDKPVIPRISGRSVPHYDSPNPKTRELYAKTILILFKPWTRLADLKRPDQSWVEALTEFTPTPKDKRVIENLKLLHRMKDEVAAERLLRIERGLQDGGGGERRMDRVMGAAIGTEEGEEEQMQLAMAAASAKSTPIDPSVTNALDILKASNFLRPHAEGPSDQMSALLPPLARAYV